MTASAMPPSRTAAAAVPAISVSAAGSGRLRRHLRGDVRRTWAAARRGQGGPSSRQRSALQPRDLAGGGVPRQADDGARRRPRSPARAARAAAPNQAREPDHLPRPATATAGCARSRASSRSSAPARPARAPARSSRSRARSCGGQGRARREKTLSVNIPAGVEDGTRIRLAGEGEVGLRGAPGGRSLHLRQRRAAPDLPARRRQRLLPRADPDHDGGARRHDRGADRGGHAARGSRCRRGPSRATSSACAARA